MLAKYWKKIGIVILVIACIINITYKIIKSTPVKSELKNLTNIFDRNGVYNSEDKDLNSLQEQMYGNDESEI